MKYQNTFQWNESISGAYYSCWTYRNEKNTSYPMHCHSYYEIAYVTEGRRKQFYNGTYHPAQEGYLFFFTPLTAHGFYNQTDVKDVILQFSAEFLRANAPDFTTNTILALHTPEIPYINIAEQPSLKKLLVQLEKCSNSVENINTRNSHSTSQQIQQSLQASALLLQLIDGLFDLGFICFQKEGRSHSDFALLDNVINHLLTHPQKTPCMEDAADMAGVSYYHFSRLFKKATNMNYNQYCNQLKLQYIEELLVQSTMTINDIASTVGMETNSGLTRFFKKHRGISPSEYRKKYQNK